MVGGKCGIQDIFYFPLQATINPPGWPFPLGSISALRFTKSRGRIVKVNFEDVHLLLTLSRSTLSRSTLSRSTLANFVKVNFGQFVKVTTGQLCQGQLCQLCQGQLCLSTFSRSTLVNFVKVNF